MGILFSGEASANLRPDRKHSSLRQGFNQPLPLYSPLVSLCHRFPISRSMRMEGAFATRSSAGKVRSGGAIAADAEVEQEGSLGISSLNLATSQDAADSGKVQSQLPRIVAAK